MDALCDDTVIADGIAAPPQIPGIGFEAKQDLRELFTTLTNA